MSKMRIGMAASVALLALGLTGGAQAERSEMTFFITSAGSGKGADLGGLAGADKHLPVSRRHGGCGQAQMARLSEHERRRRQTRRQCARPHRQGTVAERGGKIHRAQSRRAAPPQQYQQDDCADREGRNASTAAPTRPTPTTSLPARNRTARRSPAARIRPVATGRKAAPKAPQWSATTTGGA